MFEFTHVEKTFNIFQKMEKLPQTFYLTGSRYFGHNSISSDWDFFTDKSDGLKELGFSKLSFSAYTDDNVSEVFRFKQGGTQVDVQVVRCVEAKNASQKALFAMFGQSIRHFTKEQRHLIWNAMYWAIQGRNQFSEDRVDTLMIVKYPNVQQIIKGLL